VSDPAGPVRLFTALQLPEDARARLAQWGRAAAAGDPSLRPVAAESLHVTLHFLGERPAGEVEGLRACVRAACTAPIVLRSAGALWLAPRRPHVLTCAMEDGSGALEALHAELGAALAGAAPGWAPERRPFHPHVTVARVRRGTAPADGAPPAAPSLRFRAAAVALMQSRLEPSGARYETLERIALRRHA